MPASAARILANQANAARSTGPRTAEGKQASRANSLKHGLTGAGVVLPEADAAEVGRLERALRDELRPTGEAGGLLVRRIATMAVRMDRAAAQEMAATSARVRKAMDEFEAPEGVDAEAAEGLRAEAGRVALFDPSREAGLARQYEAAAQRGFFRALDELRRLKREAKAADPAVVARASSEASREALGSFSRVEKELAAVQARAPEPAPYRLPGVPNPSFPADLMTPDRGFDVPISIGRRR